MQIGLQLGDNILPGGYPLTGCNTHVKYMGHISRRKFQEPWTLKGRSEGGQSYIKGPPYLVVLWGKHVLLISATLGFLGLEVLILIKAFLYQELKESTCYTINGCA